MACTSSLQTQLLARVKTFQETFPSITQADIGRHCGIGEANFSAAIAGRRGLSANSVLQLHRLLSLPKHEVIAKFNQPIRSAKFVNFQSLGRSMHLDNDRWYPGTDGSGAGQDPNDATDSGIDNAPDADTTAPVWDQALIDTLREVRRIHRQAYRAIQVYIAKAKTNAGITTPSGVSQKFSARRILRGLGFASSDDGIDTTDTVRNMLAVLGQLDPATRAKVIAAIFKAFPKIYQKLSI